MTHSVKSGKLLNLLEITNYNGGLAEWSKAADLRSVGRCPREFEPRILHYFCNFY